MKDSLSTRFRRSPYPDQRFPTQLIFSTSPRRPGPWIEEKIPKMKNRNSLSQQEMFPGPAGTRDFGSLGRGIRKVEEQRKDSSCAVWHSLCCQIVTCCQDFTYCHFQRLCLEVSAAQEHVWHSFYARRSPSRPGN